ncbi:hypothetical protein ACHAQJ_009244 [Trichoderma viride]
MNSKREDSISGPAITASTLKLTFEISLSEHRNAKELPDITWEFCAEGTTQLSDFTGLWKGKAVQHDEYKKVPLSNLLLKDMSHSQLGFVVTQLVAYIANYELASVTGETSCLIVDLEIITTTAKDKEHNIVKAALMAEPLATPVDYDYPMYILSLEVGVTVLDLANAIRLTLTNKLKIQKAEISLEYNAKFWDCKIGGSMKIDKRVVEIDLVTPLPNVSDHIDINIPKSLTSGSLETQLNKATLGLEKEEKKSMHHLRHL